MPALAIKRPVAAWAAPSTQPGAAVAQRRPWAILGVRLALFAGWQSLFAAGFALSGAADPWRESAAWWLISASLANLTTIGLLAWLTHREGSSLLKLYGWNRRSWRRDLVWMGAALIVLGPLGFFPGPLLATLLFGDPTAVTPMMFQPLPAWAMVVAGVAFPTTVALSELPLYFGYAVPRLKMATRLGWPIVLVAATALALQHIALPLVFDARFMAWRFGMFLPFAIAVGWLINRRPSLLPYLMALHLLLDAQLVFLIPR